MGVFFLISFQTCCFFFSNNALKKVDKEIKKLQAKEVDFDDEDESDYILECKLKKRFARAYKMLCDITGCLDYDPVPKIEYSGNSTQP